MLRLISSWFSFLAISIFIVELGFYFLVFAAQCVFLMVNNAFAEASVSASLSCVWTELKMQMTMMTLMMMMMRLLLLIMGLPRLERMILFKSLKHFEHFEHLMSYASNYGNAYIDAYCS